MAAAAAAKSIVLITGANSGIGYELASQLISSPTRHVILCSRSRSKGAAALSRLQSLQKPGSISLLELDVTNATQISSAAAEVSTSFGRLDAIVNNAAVASFPDDTPLAEQMTQSFLTNATGPALVVEAFGHLLTAGKNEGTAAAAAAGTGTLPPRIVNISSGVGSIARRMNPQSATYSISAIHYRASKAALNMVTADQEVRYGAKGVKVFAFDPGFTVSNLSTHNNEGNGAKPVSEGASPIVDILEGKRDTEHGRFLHNTGEYEW